MITRKPLALDDRDRRILALAVPALFTLAVEPMYVLVDTAIVGRLGAVPLAGLALASTVLTSLLWAFNFLSFGVTTRVAFETGAGDRRAASGVAVQALWLALVIGGASALVVAIAAEPLARVLGGHGASLHAAVTYLHISALSMPAALIMLASHGVFRGWSDTRTPLVVVLVSNVINVALEVVFVYWFDWGVAGSAWGTVIAELLAAVWFVGLISRAVVATGARLRPAMEEARRLLSIGRHIVARTVLSLLVALALATAAAGRIGTTALGGHQIAQQMFVFLALATDALAVAAQALVGTASGAGDTAEADADTARLMRLGLMVGGASTIVVVATSPVLPHVFSSDGRVIHSATVALVFLGIMQVPGVVVFVLDGVLMGRSEFAYVKWVTLAALVAYVPFAAAVFVRPANGLAVVWGGLVVWMCVRAALELSPLCLGVIGLGAIAALLRLAACSSGEKAAAPAAMPVARTEIAGTAWHGDIVVVGGMTADGTATRRADLYNAFNNTWSPLAPLPIAVHHAGVALLDRLYVVGGYTIDNVASARVFSLGHGDAAWAEEPPLPEPRGALAVAAVGGSLIVAGGVVGGQATASTVVFVPGAGWRAGPALARAREHLAATSAGGRAYVIAGRVGSDNFNDVESWDGVDAAGWRREPSLNVRRGGIAAATVGDRPCVAGGEQPAGTIASIECLERGRWRRVARLARPRHGLVVAAVGSQLHVIGGGPKPGLTVSTTHEVFAVAD